MHTTHYSSFPLRKTLLALAIGAASQTAMAADAAAAKQPGEETLIVEANETSDFKSGGDLVVPAFLDGQIGPRRPSGDAWRTKSDGRPV
ncbi:putative TonB-dependent receptor [Klebsiella pneumoniae]|nr:putative TonB-dependent receptor [Klebsiella pneumoniae]